MRYIGGFLIGVLATVILQYNSRSLDIDKSHKAILFSAEKAMYTGCLTGFQAVLKFEIPSEAIKLNCRIETIEYMRPLREIYGTN